MAKKKALTIKIFNNKIESILNDLKSGKFKIPTLKSMEDFEVYSKEVEALDIKINELRLTFNQSVKNEMTLKENEILANIFRNLSVAEIVEIKKKMEGDLSGEIALGVIENPVSDNNNVSSSANPNATIHN